MAYRAYNLSLNGEEAPVIDGMTGDQRFFMAWAQVWGSKQREKALLKNDD
jgi:putative endopeptidase